MNTSEPGPKGRLILTVDFLPLDLIFGDREYRLCGTNRGKLALRGAQEPAEGREPERADFGTYEVVEDDPEPTDELRRND